MRIFGKLLLLFSIVMGGMFFLDEGHSVHAVKKIPDGGATSNKYDYKKDTKKVDHTVEKMWDNGKVNPTNKSGKVTFVRGGKNPNLYSAKKGNRLAYDIYAGDSSEVKKRGFSLVGNGNYLRFNGFSIIDGHHHHAKKNQATYIGLVNKNNKTDKRIFKAMMHSNTSASKEFEFDHRPPKYCSEKAFNKIRDDGGCNMRYDYTQFRAYIPLDEVFGDGDKNVEWDVFLIKRVEDKIVYDKLVLPFENKSFEWKTGDVSLESGQDYNKLMMVRDQVIKRNSPNSSANAPTDWDYRYFAPGKTYRTVGLDEKKGVSNFFQVYDNVSMKGLGPNWNHKATKKNMWASSIYWQFGGSQATLKYDKQHVDVNVKHVDARTGKVLKQEKEQAPYRSSKNWSLNPKTKGKLKDSKGKEIKSGRFSYVADPSSGKQKITKKNIRDDFNVTFTYQSYVDVNTNHYDENTGEIIKQETKKKQYDEAYKSSPKKRGTFENNVGYPYVSLSDKVSFKKLKGQEVKLSEGIGREQTIDFYYKTALPDPSGTVEVGEGKNTHGHVEGEAYWELFRDDTLSESNIHAKNKFEITGNHYATRNKKHTLNIGADNFTSSDKIEKKANPSDVKNKNMEYDYEYEYTNHYKTEYSCVEKVGNDCMEWKHEKTSPDWDAPYGKRFKLSETEGSFTRQKTSRLGRINDENVRVYNDLDDNKGEKAGRSKLDLTFYIKEKAVKGNDVYYKMSTAPAKGFHEYAIGWVDERDITSYTHTSMDKKKKDLVLNGKGNSYENAWGDTKQKVHEDSSLKDKEFKVDLTELVGEDIWYRGKIEGNGTNVWVKQDGTDSDEIPQYQSIDESIIEQGESPNILTLKMDHQHGETLKEKTVNDIIGQKLVVGRSDTVWSNDREKATYHEVFEKSSSDFKHENELETQSHLSIKPDKLSYKVHLPSGRHEDNSLKVLQKGWIHGNYYPIEVDENLKEDLKNHSKREDLGDYAIFLQQDEMKDKGVKEDDRTFEMEFVSDYQFVSDKTGFITPYPFAYQLNRHLQHDDTKPTEKKAVEMAENKVLGDFFRSEDYDYKDEIIGVDGDSILSEKDLQRYYLPINPESKLEPNETYTNHVFLENVGLSDVKWEYEQSFSFEHYLLGSGHDDAWLIEQEESKISDFSDEDIHSLTVKNGDIDRFTEMLKERPKKKAHHFRMIDLDIGDEVQDFMDAS